MPILRFLHSPMKCLWFSFGCLNTTAVCGRPLKFTKEKSLALEL